MLDYKDIITKHYALHMSGREIAAALGVSKSGVNGFLSAFDKCDTLHYPLPPGITNYGIAELVYRGGLPEETRDLSFELPDFAEVEKQLSSRKNMTLVFLWGRYKNRCTAEGKKFYSYHLDQEINDRGIMIDPAVVEQAIRIDKISKADLMSRMQRMTGLENPNSVTQMKGYLAENGLETDSLGKKNVQEMIKTAPEDLAEVLSLRMQLAKSSVRKYQAMQNAVCTDGRCHGMFQFYGANRSGRWAGRLIQLQNLPQNHMEDLEQARDLVKQGDYEMLDMLYDSVPGVLSELIRTAFIPRPGYKFIVSDFSAIEARVLSHLAGEKWRAEVFRTGGDIYCASASQMFHVPVEKHGINGHLRQKGKIAELALGYGGSVGALKAMGALDMGLSEDELQPLVNMWRDSNPNIVDYWWQVDNAVKTAIKLRIPTKVGSVQFVMRNGMLFITLPSGRKLAYVKPRIGENKFGGESVTYMGIDAKKKWSRIESYGPKFTENIVQAVSRDILAYAMRTLSHCFIVGHIHDELIIEASKDVSLKTICEQMGKTPPWIPGLLLRADGYETMFYKKD